MRSMTNDEARMTRECLMPNDERTRAHSSGELRHSSVIRAFSFVIAINLLVAAAADAGDWLHWRGPEQTGVGRDTGLPDKWSPNKPGENNLIWKQPIGARSTPVVCRGR